MCLLPNPITLTHKNKIILDLDYTYSQIVYNSLTTSTNYLLFSTTTWIESHSYIV